MSLQLSTEHRVKQHVAAFVIAWLAVSVIFLQVLRPITVSQPQPGYHIPMLGKSETAVRNLLYLSAALRGDKTIVLLGSSELDKKFSDGPYTPDIFFPSRHLAPALTYGKPGFEIFGMYGLLYALRAHLNPGTRLVLMLSPGWFRTTDMSPASFDDNFNDTTLLQLYLSDDPRGVLHDYLTAHAADFTAMTHTQQLFLGDPSSIVDWNLPMFIARTINSRAYAQREKLNLYLASLDQPDSLIDYGSVHSQDLPWGRYEQVAHAREAANMNGNDLWVRNKFYLQAIKRHPERYKDYFPPDMNPEPEMNSLRLLLQMLQRSKVKALLVMQPVNSRMYEDLDRFDDVDARIANLCREYGMQYMDMYGQPQEQGDLRDGSHPGDVGWLKIDRGIAGYFKL